MKRIASIGLILVLAVCLMGCVVKIPASKLDIPAKPTVPVFSDQTENTPTTEAPTQPDNHISIDISTAPTTGAKDKIGVASAKKAAFAHAKVNAADARDVEVELDNERGNLHYDVSFEAGGYDYDYDIDAYTGKVVRSEKERDA